MATTRTGHLKRAKDAAQWSMTTCSSRSAPWRQDDEGNRTGALLSADRNDLGLIDLLTLHDHTFDLGWRHQEAAQPHDVADARDVLEATRAVFDREVTRLEPRAVEVRRRQFDIDLVAAVGQITLEQARALQLEFIVDHPALGAGRHQLACGLPSLLHRQARCAPERIERLHFAHAVQARKRYAPSLAPFDDAIKGTVKPGVSGTVDCRQIPVRRQ